MSLVLSPEEEQYYRNVWVSATSAPPGTLASISGAEAVPVLESSGLNQVELADIWRICDPNDRGSLDWTSFCSFLRLIALHQSGTAIESITQACNPPSKLPNLNISDVYSQDMQMASYKADPYTSLIAAGGLELPPTPPMGPMESLFTESVVDWKVSPDDKQGYIELFNRYDASSTGTLDGAKAKEILQGSGLPDDVLYGVWNLADVHGKGYLDLGQFIVAAHLVARMLQGAVLPSAVPPVLAVEFKPAGDHSTPIGVVKSLSDDDTPAPNRMTSKSVSEDFAFKTASDDKDMDPFDQRVKMDSLDNAFGDNRSNSGSLWNDNTGIRSNKAVSEADTEDFKYSATKTANNGFGIDPVGILTAVIEGDRSMKSFVQNATTGLVNEFDTLRNLNAALIADLQEQRQDLTNQLLRREQIEGEVAGLKAEYDNLTVLRRDISEQLLGVQKQTEALESQKAQYQSMIVDAEKELQFLIGMTADNENALKHAETNVQQVALSRHEIICLLKEYEENRKRAEGEIEDLHMTLKRLQEEKQRIAASSAETMQQFRQTDQDLSVLYNATDKSLKQLVIEADKGLQSANSKHQLLNSLRNVVPRENMSPPPVSRSPKDCKGVPVRQNNPSVHNTAATPTKSWVDLSTTKPVEHGSGLLLHKPSIQRTAVTHAPSMHSVATPIPNKPHPMSPTPSFGSRRSVQSAGFMSGNGDPFMDPFN